MSEFKYKINDMVTHSKTGKQYLVTSVAKGRLGKQYFCQRKEGSKTVVELFYEDELASLFEE